MTSDERRLFRLIDANLNRLREGVRVVEDTMRYLRDDAVAAKALKAVRHEARVPFETELLAARDAAHDVGRPTTGSEAGRADMVAVVTANFKRAQESARVLEECLKVLDPAEAERFKAVRYTLYTLEKELLT